MGEIVLYHGSFNKVVVPQYGLGETKHDYGKGFYLTENVELAYSKLTKIEDGLICVDYNEFNEKYNKRDINARKNMHKLVDSDINKVTNVFSTLI